MRGVVFSWPVARGVSACLEALSHPRFERFNVLWGAPRCLDLTSVLPDLSVARHFFESARAFTYAWHRVCVRTCAASFCFLEWRTIAPRRRGRGTTSRGGAGRTLVLRMTVGGLLALGRLLRPANPLLWIYFQALNVRARVKTARRAPVCLGVRVFGQYKIRCTRRASACPSQCFYHRRPRG